MHEGAREAGQAAKEQLGHVLDMCFATTPSVCLRSLAAAVHSPRLHTRRFHCCACCERNGATPCPSGPACRPVAFS